MDISVPYYEDKTRISNSNIGWFLNKGPAYLHKMLTEDVPEEKNSVLERGTMIHEYILQPEEFEKDYVVWDKPKPTSVQQEKFCQELANTVEIEPNKAILSAYKEVYSTAGKSEDKMLSEGLKIASTLKDYIDFLKANDGRIMISHWDYKMLEKIKQNIKSHKYAKNIFATDNIAEELEHYHEFHINWDYVVPDAIGPSLIACKSLLDGLFINLIDKQVVIYDLKTTQKLWHFEDSIDQYDYLRQLCYYTMAVEWYLKEELKQNPEEFEFKYYIIGIDTTGSNEIRVFKIEPYMVQSRENVIVSTLNNIRWHQKTGKWDHSREYYEGDGSESLDL